MVVLVVELMVQIHKRGRTNIKKKMNDVINHDAANWAIMREKE